MTAPSTLCKKRSVTVQEVHESIAFVCEDTIDRPIVNENLPLRQTTCMQPSVQSLLPNVPDGVNLRQPVVLDFQTRTVRQVGDGDDYFESIVPAVSAYSSYSSTTSDPENSEDVVVAGFSWEGVQKRVTSVFDYHFISYSSCCIWNSWGTVKAHIGKIIWSSSGWRHKR